VAALRHPRDKGAVDGMTRLGEPRGIPLRDEDLTPCLLPILRAWFDCYKAESNFWLRDALQAAYEAGRDAQRELDEEYRRAREAATMVGSRR
jgi:hypothetical protein